MKEPGYAEVHVSCECGCKHTVLFSDIRREITCPSCGSVDLIEPAQLPAIEAAFGRALMAATAQRDAGVEIAIGSADVLNSRDLRSAGGDDQNTGK